METAVEKVLDLIAKQDYEEAKKELKQLIIRFPDENELYNLYGYCNKCIEDICEEEDFDTADEKAKSCAKLDLWEKMYPAIQSKADEGNYKSAYTLLRLLGDYPEVKEEDKWRGESHPRVSLCKDRAVCAFLMGDMEQAKSDYLCALDMALSLCPPRSYGRVRYLIKKKEYTEALRLTNLQIITGRFRGKPDAVHTKYQIHKALGETQKAQQIHADALHYLELEIRMRPLAYYLYKKQANWLIEAGDLQKALAQNAKAIALWPGYYGYRVQRAEIFARLGQADKAHKLLESLEKGNWYRLDEYRPYQKAQVYECLGDLETAEKYYSAATLVPRKRYDQLYDFYKRQGREDDSIKLRAEQRKEPHFQDRVSESELIALI